MRLLLNKYIPISLDLIPMNQLLDEGQLVQKQIPLDNPPTRHYSP
jgi:hypothetical protein